MIIALGIEPNSGKDSCVMFAMDYLRLKFKNLDIQQEGFADRVYNLCHELYGWAGFRSKQYYNTNPHKKEEILSLVGKTPRQLLIGIAEKVREFDPDAWLEPVYRNRPKHLKWLTDLRTEREMIKGKQLGAYFVRIDRDNRPKIECKVSAELRERPDIWDRVLKNNGTLAQFKDTVVNFCDEVVVPHIMKRLCGEI